MKKRVYSICMACLAVLLVAGCGTPVSAPSATVEMTPSPTAMETPTPTLITTPTPVTEKRIGFVRDAYTHDGIDYIVIDYVSFLTGDDAVEKAKEDGMAEQDMDGTWYVPNDYYIANDNPALRTFPLSGECTIGIIDFSGAGGGLAMIEITLAELKAYDLADGRMLMHVDVKNGVVENLEEQYRP